MTPEVPSEPPGPGHSRCSRSRSLPGGSRCRVRVPTVPSACPLPAPGHTAGNPSLIAPEMRGRTAQRLPLAPQGPFLWEFLQAALSQPERGSGMCLDNNYAVHLSGQRLLYVGA